MARQPRQRSGTGIYHVMLRGINRKDTKSDNGALGSVALLCIEPSPLIPFYKVQLLI